MVAMGNDFEDFGDAATTISQDLNGPRVPVSEEVFSEFLGALDAENPAAAPYRERRESDGLPTLPLLFAVDYTVGKGGHLTHTNLMPPKQKACYDAMEALAMGVFKGQQALIDSSKVQLIQSLTDGVTDEQSAQRATRFLTAELEKAASSAKGAARG